MMEAGRASETSFDNYFTRQYIPADNSEQFNILPLSAHSSLMMEAARTSETSVDIILHGSRLHPRRQVWTIQHITTIFPVIPNDGGSTYLWNVGLHYFTRQYIPEDNSEQFNILQLSAHSSLMVEAACTSETSVDNYFHAAAALYSGEKTPGTHCTGGWVGPRAGLDTEATGEILCPCRGSNSDRPVVQPVVRHYAS
jgi:hypothetical protein